MLISWILSAVPESKFKEQASKSKEQTSKTKVQESKTKYKESKILLEDSRYWQIHIVFLTPQAIYQKVSKRIFLLRRMTIHSSQSLATIQDTLWGLVDRNPTPPPIQVGRSEEYKVEYIHEDCTHYKTPQYYVKWKGYLPKKSTWEPLSKLLNAQLAIQQYLEKKTRKRGAPGRKGMEKPYVNQSRQETAQLPVGSNPGPPEIADPNQEEQKPANLPSVNTGGLKSTLETLELNPNPPKTTQVTQSGQEPANLLNCKPELMSYSETCQSPKDNSPNGHQIAANLAPPKIQTYVEVVACLKEQLTVFHPEWVVQLNYSCDVVNSGSGTKHCHFYSSEQAQPGSAVLKTLRQDLCPVSALSANLNPAKFKEVKPHMILYINSGQVDHQENSLSGDQSANPTQALYLPPVAPFGPVHFTKYPPNPAYTEYNLETILIADPLARTRETEYIGHEGKWYKRPPRLFKDKYNYLPAYFVSMTLPLTLQPNHPVETPTAAKTTSTQLFGVLYITLMGMIGTMLLNSGPWSFLGQSVYYIIKLAPILWWALPSGPAVFCPKPTNASTYAWLSDTKCK
ncbi:Cbx7p [Entomophthora muscae]|uniref:Cbx7p n=1 Tax=Entomophthora muscae TaxID=34485 RepID=A0ACC2TVZ5_9FUNG|nr:Cbx7p [Entomophthora muscae]